MYIAGLQQELMYNRSASRDTRLYYNIVHDTKEYAATGDVTIKIWTPDENTVLVASTAMTQQSTGSATYYYQADTTASTADWSQRENYIAQVNYTVQSQTARRVLFFDVAQYPFNNPMISSDQINAAHPDWINSHPDGATGTWTYAIEAAHGEVMRLVRGAGCRIYDLPKAMTELYPYLLAFTEAEVVKFGQFRNQEYRNGIIEYSRNLWAARGAFTFDVDSSVPIGGGTGSLARPRRSR